MPNRKSESSITFSLSEKRRTVILVTHSLMAASRCDRVFVMQAGRIVERGTPLELLNRGGLYADLVQSGELRTAPHAA